MDRRTFLRTTTAAAATTAAVSGNAAAGESPLGAPAIISSHRELSFSSPWSADVPVFSSWATELAARLQSALGESCRIVAGQPPSEADLVFVPVDAAVATEPAFAFFAGLPGSLGFAPERLHAWLAVGGGQMLWDDLSARHGWKPLLAGHGETAPGLWGNRPLLSAPDFAGTTVAIAGLGGHVARVLGATPLEPAPLDLAAALRDGRIAAAEWGTPLATLMLGLASTTTHFYTTGFQSTGTALALNIRIKTWERFGASERAILEGIAAQAFALSVAEARTHRRLALDAIRQVPALTVSDLPRDVAATIDSATTKVVDELASASTTSLRIRDSYLAFARLMGDPPSQNWAIS